MSSSGFYTCGRAKDVPIELHKLHPSALPKVYSFTNAVGNAKGHPYLPMGRDCAGPDHSNRHGPRKLLPTKFEGVWKGSGTLGRSLPNDTTPMSTLSSVTTVGVVHGNREWEDQHYAGVKGASAYAKYINSGAHKGRTYATPSANPWRQPGTKPKVKKEIKVNDQRSKSHITFR